MKTNNGHEKGGFVELKRGKNNFSMENGRGKERK
jgi:hypothetical protein